MTELAFIDDQGNDKGKGRGDQGRLTEFRVVAERVTGHEM
jgi:hypothetical protein